MVSTLVRKDWLSCRLALELCSPAGFISGEYQHYTDHDLKHALTTFRVQVGKLSRQSKGQESALGTERGIRPTPNCVPWIASLRDIAVLAGLDRTTGDSLDRANPISSAIRSGLPFDLHEPYQLHRGRI